MGLAAITHAAAIGAFAMDFRRGMTSAIQFVEMRDSPQKTCGSIGSLARLRVDGASAAGSVRATKTCLGQTQLRAGILTKAQACIDRARTKAFGGYEDVV